MKSFRAVVGAFTVAAGLLAVLPAQAGPQEQPLAAQDATQREMQTIQDLFARSTAEFEGPQQGRSIVLFDDLVSRLEALRKQGSLSPRGKEILLQCYEFRARAYFNIGLQEKAADSFRTLIQIQPQYVVSRDKVSPKIVDFFSSVKKALVGYLAVSSQPPGARVTLNGEFLSLTDFFPLEVLAGEYVVEITREGYRPESRSVSIAPRATETLQVDLVRTAASAFFITEPPGVEVWVDGELKATTAGTLAPDLADAARSKGLDPSRASARTEIANLSLGSHVVELKRKCYESVKTTVELPEAQDYDIAPVLMEESVASLMLKSDPPGGRIFLDGESMGVTPRELEGVCSGKHRLEVKHASGKFIKDLVLARNEEITLDCPIRPSLSFLGVVADKSGESVVSDVEERISQNLAAMTSLNFVPAPRETVDRILEGERVTRRSLVAGQSTGVDPDVVRRVTEKLASTLEVQGFLVAVLPEERLQRTAILHLLAAGNTVADTWDVTYAEPASFLRFISAVDQKTTQTRPWSGLILVDTTLFDGPPVLRVVPGSPAAQAGIQAGEILLNADSKPMKRALDFLSLVDQEKAGARIALQLRAATGATRAVDLSLGETPQEIPLNDPSLLYNKVMMDLRQKVEGYPGTEEAAFARLNLAICAMHFGDYAAAHSFLMKARNELPQRPGLSQGTALYYLGLSLENLGTEYKKEAMDAYKAASAFKDATLFNNDGPAVAPLAARRAGP